MKQILFQDEPLTEKQVTNIRAWIKRLRDPNEKQCKEKLFDGIGHCCLGIAERVLGNDPLLENNIWWFGVTDVYMPGDDWKAFGLRSSTGDFSDNYEAPNCLADMNDDGKTFLEIADFIEAQLKLKLEAK